MIKIHLFIIQSLQHIFPERVINIYLEKTLQHKKLWMRVRKRGGNIYILPYSHTKLRSLQFDDMEYSIQVILLYFSRVILIFNNSNHTK